MVTTAASPDVARKPRWRRWLRRFMVLFGLPYLVVVGLLAFFQRSLIYHPSRETPNPAVLKPADETVTIRTEDGLELQAWWLKARSSAETAGEEAATPPRMGPLVVYFCGNAGDRSDRFREFDILTGAGADVLCCDYRGYAKNAGSPSEEGLARDARAVWNFATRERNVPASKIVLLGESLGGGVAVRLASEVCGQGTPPGGLIVRSSFSSLADVAATAVPWIPGRWLLIDRFPSAERIAKVTSPILVLHGRRDEIVPFELGQKLFAAAPRDSTNGYANRFVELPRADHNDVLEAEGGKFREAVRELLEYVAAR